MRRLLIILVIGTLTALGVTIVSGYYMAKKALKPVDKIRKAAVKISSRNLEEYIDIGPRKDELGKLADTFNAMISRLSDAFQRINQFSIDVSHELKTPLTILKGGTEVALRKERETATNTGRSSQAIWKKSIGCRGSSTTCCCCRRPIRERCSSTWRMLP